METTPNTPITVTFTMPVHRDMPYQEYRELAEVKAASDFDTANAKWSKIKSAWYVRLDMTKAHVALTPDFIIDTDHTYNNEKTILTKTYTVNKMWAVFAPYITTGAVVVAQGNSKEYFATEAEATKHMKKLTKAAAEWHAAEALRNQYAAQAQAVCALDGKTATPAGLIDDSDCIGHSVKIHQMGKFRTGIIVGQTPTKYVVVYTTPSNPTEIRTTKVGKDGSK